MKNAQELWKQHFETLTVEDIVSIQLDAKQDAAQRILAYLQQFWGHEIVRALGRNIAKAFTLPEPTEPFHPERLHPGANRPAVPPKAPEVPLQGKAPPAPASKGAEWAHCCQEDSLGSLQPSSHPNPKTSNPPRYQAPSPPHPEAACLPCADPPVPAAAPVSSSPPTLPPLSEVLALDALRHRIEQLERAQERRDAPWIEHDSRLEAIEQHLALDAKPPALERIVYSERRLDAWHAQLRDLEATELATASELRERIEALESENAKRAEHLAKTGEYLQHAYERIEALEAKFALFLSR